MPARVALCARMAARARQCNPCSLTLPPQSSMKSGRTLQGCSKYKVFHLSWPRAQTLKKCPGDCGSVRLRPALFSKLTTWKSIVHTLKPADAPPVQCTASLGLDAEGPGQPAAWRPSPAWRTAQRSRPRSAANSAAPRSFLRHLRTLRIAFLQAPVLHEITACHPSSGCNVYMSMTAHAQTQL